MAEQTTDAEDRQIAEREEVLRFFTAVMRGESEGATFKDQMHAAELLGKRYELFAASTETDGASGVTIVDDVREASP